MCFEKEHILFFVLLLCFIVLFIHLLHECFPDLLIDMVCFILQTALKYSEKYGVDKVRVLTLKENRGKGGAVRLVSIIASPTYRHQIIILILVFFFFFIFFYRQIGD